MIMLRNSPSPCAGGLVLLLAMIGSGCHRGYYREQADAEASHLIREKANHPHWDLVRQSIDIDPRSRMFDPFNPDAEPMPTDDPTSHQLMHYVDHKEGYPGWHANCDTDAVENPDWMSYLVTDENGVVNMTAADAYRLSLIHSRDYQEQFETLYLSALDVSAERFRFDTQFFGGYQTVANFQDNADSLSTGVFTRQTGRSGLPAGGVTAPVAGGFVARRGFATGADLAVGLANALVWDFNGNTLTPSNVLNVGFIQPLLRRAGRDRILEQLTITERALLANVRQMERYRRAFYVEVMTGRDAGSGATRRGGFFGGSGLDGFTGVGGGGFGTVGGGGGGGGAGGIGGGGAGAAEAGGYFGLLQTQQDIRNQQLTIARLRSNLSELRESLAENLQKIPDDAEEIVREQLQIAQARQALLDAESRLLIDQASYHASLDNFKRSLGLPPQMCVNIEDSIIDQFNLIPPEALDLQNQITQLRDIVGAANERIIGSVQQMDSNGQQVSTLEWNDELETNLRTLRASLERMRAIQQRVTSGALAETRKDIDELVGVLPQRKNDLLSLKQKYSQELDRFARYGGLDPCQMTLLVDLDPAVFDTVKLDVVPSELESEAERLGTKFHSYDDPFAQIQEVLDELLNAQMKPTPEELHTILEQQVVFQTPSLLSELSDDILDLLLVQARARTHSVRVEPIDLDWQMAFEMAKRYRRDWMNARAALVDSWRLIEFNADNLEGILDLEMNGTLRDSGVDNLQLALRFDAPISRLQERNTYRQALIEYQQAKRNYYAFMDGIGQSLRNTIRTIERNRVNFEQRRIAVLSAIEQVVLNDQISKLREERGQAAGVTAARDVVSALGDLQSAQNDFLNVWVNYEVQRLNLDLDLGTMNLDPEGFWMDPGPIGEEYGFPTPLGFEGDTPDYIFEPSMEPELLPQPGNTDELPTPDVPDPENASARRRPHSPLRQPPIAQVPLPRTRPAMPVDFQT
ncbi:MAG: hypothetical protein CMJ64_09570 [Planctomycetaceae bacterium]|nr:hypothetical protein [Planctomycetaceae bacterium]